MSATNSTRDKDAVQSNAMMADAAERGSAPANAPGKPSIPDITCNSSFTQKIGIEVLPFRGIEPKLMLNYNAARKTRLGGHHQGWLRYAWGIDRFDVIERVSPGYGYSRCAKRDARDGIEQRVDRSIARYSANDMIS